MIRTLHQLVARNADFELVEAAYHLGEVRDPAHLVRAAQGSLVRFGPMPSLVALSGLRKGSYGDAWMLFPAALSELKRVPPDDDLEAQMALLRAVTRGLRSGDIDPIEGAIVLAQVWSWNGHSEMLKPFFVALNVTDGSTEADSRWVLSEALDAFDAVV